MIYFWQAKLWQQLWQAREKNRLPHALLFAGVSGLGKLEFANDFSRLLLCKHQYKHAINVFEELNNECDCHSCCLSFGQTHPNILWIKPEKLGTAIKVDQIRQLTEFVQQSSFQGEYRVVIIERAHAMNASAANAILKILEEPAAHAILILISQHSGFLPRTIVSRCQYFNFQVPSFELAISWITKKLSCSQQEAKLLLNLTNRAPLAAVHLASSSLLSMRKAFFADLSNVGQAFINPLTLAKKMESFDLLSLIDFLLSWTMDLLRLLLGAETHQLINIDFLLQLMKLKQQIKREHCLKFLNYLQKQRKYICVGVNLNKQLLIESLLLHWDQYINPRQRLNEV